MPELLENWKDYN